MIRSVASRVAWAGRIASMVFGLVLVMALLFGVASVGLAANGKPFILGKATNTATKVTGLIGKVATGSSLFVSNPSGGSALGLEVNAGQAPLTVNADAGKATNLDADKLDGKDQSAFASVSELDAATVISEWSALPTQGTYTSEGGTLVISAAGSGFRSDSDARTVGDIGMRILVDGTERGQALLRANELDSHKPFVARQVVVKGLAAGSHTIRLEAIYGSNCNTDSETRISVCTTTNSNDRFEVTVLELSD